MSSSSHMFLSWCVLVVASCCVLGQDTCDIGADTLPDVSLLQTGTQLKLEAPAHRFAEKRVEDGRERLQANYTANVSWVDDTFDEGLRSGLDAAAQIDERLVRSGRSWTKAWCFVGLCSFYGLCCVLYETLGFWRSSNHASAGVDTTTKPEKPRHEEWDLIKFTLNYCVVYTHFMEFTFTHYFLRPWFKWYMNLPASFMMSSFAIMSGVFGQSITRTSLARMLCYTYGTAYLAGVAHELLVALDTGGYDWYSIFGNPDYRIMWYLPCLASWRLLISPAFHFGSSAGAPPILIFSVVCVVCYIGWHTTTANVLPYVPTSNFFGTMLSYNMFEGFTHGPFFALGHTMPLSRWSAILRDGRFIFLGAAFTVAWYGALACSEWFREWNKVACLGDCGNLLTGMTLNIDTVKASLCVGNRHFPFGLEHGAATLTREMFVMDMRNYALKGAISIAILWAIVAPLPVLKRFAPTFIRVVCRGGSRTLYSYVLHFLLVHDLATLLDFPKFYGKVPEAYVPAFVLCVALCSVLLTTCALTERLLSWMVMPFWLMDLCGCIQTTEDRSATTTKCVNDGEKALDYNDRPKPSV